MSYRGRLIFPFYATVARLNTAATAAALSGDGYDHVFREPAVDDGGDGADDVSARRESTVEGVACQVHTESGSFEKLAQAMGGPVKQYQLNLLFHYSDLEARGLVDADGSAVFKVNDRLVAVRDNVGNLVRDFTGSPLYATQVQDRSFGLSGLRRNLLMVTFEQRDTSAQGV